MKRRTVLQGLAALALARGFAQTNPDPTNPDYLKLAAQYSAQNRGISMLVMVDGKTIFEDYPNGGSATRNHELASGTKSFSGVMAVIAQQEGQLQLDELVSQTIPEWKSDARRSRVTLNQLLHLTSGIPGGSIGRPLVYSEAIQTPAQAEPGTRFSYGPTPYQIFGEVMRRKLQGDPVVYMQRKIFEPIGLDYGSWRRGQDGNPHLPSGAFMTARNWAKFGELVRLGGAWQGQQIVDSALLDKCFEGSTVNPRYGLTWWLNRPITAEQLGAMGRVGQAADFNPNQAPDMVMAAGAGDQRLYVVRSLKLVLVRQAEGIVETFLGRRSQYSDAEFISLLLTGKGRG